MVLVGSATAASTFLIILMLWTFLLAVERLSKSQKNVFSVFIILWFVQSIKGQATICLSSEKEPKYCLGPDGLHSGSGLVTLVPQTSSAVSAGS